MQTPMANPDQEAGYVGKIKWPLFTLPLDLTSGSGFGTGRQLKMFVDPHQ
jgi:hypothetical protein